MRNQLVAILSLLLLSGMAWSQNHGARVGLLPPNVLMHLQERAYTSPIWYTP